MQLPANRTHLHHRSRQRGSILVACMVLAALGTIGVAAWLSLLDARGHQVEQNITALERRAIYQNSKSLAYLAIYRNHLHDGNGVTSDVTYTLPDDLGQAVVKSYAGAPLEEAALARTTKIGAAPLHSYSTDATVEISDGVGDYTWQFQLRNYNPILGGDLLTMHPTVDFDSPAAIVSGNLSIKGRAMFWDSASQDFSSAVKADQFLLPNDIDGTSVFSTTGGDTTLPLNYPIPLQTIGTTAAGASYSGELDIISSATNSHNAYVDRVNATGNAITIQGNAENSIGPGPDTNPDGPDDATLLTEIETQSPAYLESELPNHYPLSSVVLDAVADKDNPPLSEDQIYAIYEAHIPIPNDALTHLMGSQSSRIGSRTDELHRENGTWVASDGQGTVRVLLESPSLPHLVLESTSNLILLGQNDAITASAAAALDPRVIAVANAGSDSLDRADFQGQNLRRIVLGVSTPTGIAGSGTYTPEFVFDAPAPFPAWHVIFELENTGALFDTSAVAGVTVVGGIRANRRIEVTSGSLTLEQQFDRAGYEALLSRNAWIEAFRQ